MAQQDYNKKKRENFRLIAENPVIGIEEITSVFHKPKGSLDTYYLNQLYTKVTNLLASG